MNNDALAMLVVTMCKLLAGVIVECSSVVTAATCGLGHDEVWKHSNKLNEFLGKIDELGVQVGLECSDRAEVSDD